MRSSRDGLLNSTDSLDDLLASLNSIDNEANEVYENSWSFLGSQFYSFSPEGFSPDDIDLLDPFIDEIDIQSESKEILPSSGDTYSDVTSSSVTSQSTEKSTTQEMLTLVKRIQDAKEAPDMDFYSAEQLNMLRNTQTYYDAVNANDYLFMGRSAEIYKLVDPNIYPDYYSHVMDVKKYSQDWTIELNIAFWIGGIESRKDFIILTPLSNIANRAKRGLAGKRFTEGQLGWAVAEMLWLQDNGYRFLPDRQNTFCTRAIPPENPSNIIIKRYGLASAPDAERQVARIRKIAQEVEAAKHFSSVYPGMFSSSSSSTPRETKPSQTNSDDGDNMPSSKRQAL